MKRNISSGRQLEHPFTPQFEALESRCCPSVSASVFGDTLLIQGDNGDDTVIIQDQGDGSVSATITGAKNSASASGTGITNILVDTRGGSDTVNYKLDGNPLSTARNLLIDLGNGTDRAASRNKVSLDFSPGTASNLNIALLGTNGRDEVTATFGDMAGNLYLGALLGWGDDKLDVTLAGNLTDSAQVAFLVSGGLGADDLNVHRAADGDVDIAADAGLYLMLDGGFGNDKINVDYRGQLNGDMYLLAAGGEGKDTMAADLTMNAGSTGELEAGVNGGIGHDNLTLKVKDNSGGAGSSTLAGLTALVDGGLGLDTSTRTANVQRWSCENDTVI